MGKAYSLDLRERICAYVAEGNSFRSAGRLLDVSASIAVRLATEHRQHGTAVLKPQGRSAGQFGKHPEHLENSPAPAVRRALRRHEDRRWTGRCDHDGLCRHEDQECLKFHHIVPLLFV